MDLSFVSNEPDKCQYFVDLSFATVNASNDRTEALPSSTDVADAASSLVEQASSLGDAVL